MNRHAFLLVGGLSLLAASASAGVRLPEVLGDHMVLQQQSEVSLWGWAFAGETVVVETSWGAKAQTVAGAQGEWRVKVRTPAAQPLSKGLHPEHITFTVPQENEVQIKDVLIGEVWVCSGQSNMEMMLCPGFPPGWNAWYGEAAWGDEAKKADRPGLRAFDVVKAVAATPQTDGASCFPSKALRPKDAGGLLPESRRGWQPCTADTAPYFHAVAYYFGAALQERLDVPVGLMTPVVGGTPVECWMSQKSLNAVPGYANAVPGTLNPFAGSPASLFNSMVAPLTPMRIQGAIWYQGESNVGNPHYAALFQALIADWRQAFGRDDLPFYFVQIAPYRYNRGTKPAELRAAQATALQMPYTGMALSLDVGEANNIHPKNKRDIGRRLALQALAKTYHQKDLAADGPTPESLSREEGRLRLAFRDLGGGLVSRDGKPLKCFEIAGEDGIFVPANAVIAGDAVVVSSPAIVKPRSVRFAWGEADIPNLMSKNGLPAAQFEMTLPPAPR